ncbi:MAG: suppressor of fused domain protein, partial [Burkholderiaceae bacterium]
ISDHIERYLGEIETVLHEIISDTVHIDVHIVKPSADFPYIRLVTSGMSDLPMTVPAGSGAPEYVELMLTLPADWKLDQKSFEDENWFWPVSQLKYLARFPHKFQTWLGWGHTVPNGDPAEPYSPTTKLCGAIVLPSVTVPDAFHTLRIDDKKEITFYAVVPLFKDEMNLKLRSGTDELLKRFGKKGISDIFSPTRSNVAKKWFGIL